MSSGVASSVAQAVPSVSGEPVVGGTLTADPGVWPDATTYEYSWLVDGLEVAGAATQTYVPRAEDAGKAVRVSVRGTTPGSEPATVVSADTALVTLPGTASVEGAATAGETVSAVASGWAESTTYTYRWFSGDTAIDGQTGSTLLLADALIGASVAVEVTGAKAGFGTAVVRSAPVVVAARTLVTAVPTVEGTYAAGYTLTAAPGAWTEGSTFTYQWFAAGAPLAGATGSTLALGSTHVGKRISVAVTGQRSGYQGATVSSDLTPFVVAPGTPTVSGTPIMGATLTAAPGTWASGTTLALEWLADGAPIAGATGTTLAVGAALDGKALAVRVIGTRSGWGTVTRTSAATARVMRWSVPRISGTVAYGFTVTAVPGTWTSGATLRYQWYADGAALSGATSSTLALGSATKAKRITVRVVGSKAGHPTVAKVSAQTGRVPTTARPAISGTAVYGSVLTARTGTWTTSTTFRYQWFGDGAPISGATASTLKLGYYQRGKRITVRVTGSRSGYVTVARLSSATPRVATAPRPTISGTKLVTYTLTAKPGTWSTGTTFSYRWYANGYAISGATSSTLRLGSSLAGKRITVRVVGSKSGYPTVARMSAATATIGYPLRTEPISLNSCPSWAPIKGNADSMIYHLPGQRYYNVTNPEECFRTEAAAVDAGYRRAKV